MTILRKLFLLTAVSIIMANPNCFADSGSVLHVDEICPLKKKSPAEEIGEAAGEAAGNIEKAASDAADSVGKAADDLSEGAKKGYNKGN